MHDIAGRLTLGRGVRGGVGKYGEVLGGSGFRLVGEGDLEGVVGGEEMRGGASGNGNCNGDGGRRGLDGGVESGESLKGKRKSMSAFESLENAVGAEVVIASVVVVS